MEAASSSGGEEEGEADDDSSSCSEYEYESDSDAPGPAAAAGGPPEDRSPASGAAGVLHQDAVWDTLLEDAERVGETLGEPPEAAAALLLGHRWDEERLVSRWLLGGGEEQAGIASAAGGGGGPATRGECAVCFAEGPLLAVEPCGHRFCAACWSSYLRIAGDDRGPRGCLLTCMHDACPRVLTHSVWEAAGCGALYRRHAVRWRLAAGGRMRGCPAPDCPWVARVDPRSRLFRAVECRCGEVFCARCGGTWHAPASCDAMRRWGEKCRSESETSNWMMVNTKPCPKCRTRIEKNQGCNHMRCTHCDHHFCWVCMGPWDDHGPETGGFYNCNRFPDGEAAPTEGAERAKTQLERYLHYNYRYTNHGRSRRLAEERLAAAAERGDTGESGCWRLLARCRRTLQHTYVKCYYSAAGPERSLLEDQQEQLEKYTERVTEIAEGVDQAAAVPPAQLRNLEGVTDTFRRNIEERACDLHECAEAPAAGDP